MADVTPPDRPTWEKFKPDPDSARYQKDKNGNMTRHGNALYEKDLQDAKTNLQGEQTSWDALWGPQSPYGRKQTVGATSAEQVGSYLGGPTHAWYATHGGREAFGVGALGGYGLGRLTLPVAAPGSSALNRARILVMAAGEAGLGPAAEYLVSGSGPDNPHGQDVDRAYGNAGLGESFGAGAAGLFKAMHGSFGQQPSSSSESPPPKFASLGITPESARSEGVSALANFLGVEEGASKGATWKKLQPVLAKANDDQLAHIASEFGITASTNKGILDKLKVIGTKGGKIGTAALAGMAGYEALAGGDSAEAGGMPTEGPSPGESLTQYRLRGLGLPSTPGEAANAASYLAPGIGEARLGYDIGSAGGAITHALMQGAPKSVTGNLPDPRLTAFHTWLDEQKQFQNHLDELGSHLDDMKSRYGGAPSSPGAALPTGGGMPGITGVPGAGGGSPPANINPAGMPVGTPVGPSATAINPSTAAMLGLMMHGRRNAAVAALMGLGQ